MLFRNQDLDQGVFSATGLPLFQAHAMGRITCVHIYLYVLFQYPAVHTKIHKFVLESLIPSTTTDCSVHLASVLVASHADSKESDPLCLCHVIHFIGCMQMTLHVSYHDYYPVHA